MNEHEREVILGREEHGQLVYLAEGELEGIFFQNKSILVTGSEGSLGVPLVKRLKEIGAHVITLDIADNPSVDIVANVVTYDTLALQHRIRKKVAKLDFIFHLAADKHAPAGEITPQRTVDINIAGTTNMMNAFPEAQMILASTCKAADPETVYGATKMIAERIVLDSGGTVARFYNVPETSGNVFELWREQIKRGDGISVSYCSRYFISKREAIGLLIAMPQVPPGRYTINGVCHKFMKDIAERLYPDTEIGPMSPRRGDRLDEPKHAESEALKEYIGNISRIISLHDNGVY